MSTGNTTAADLCREAIINDWVVANPNSTEIETLLGIQKTPLYAEIKSNCQSYISAFNVESGETCLLQQMNSSGITYSEFWNVGPANMDGDWSLALDIMFSANFTEIGLPIPCANSCYTKPDGVPGCEVLTSFMTLGSVTQERVCDMEWGDLDNAYNALRNCAAELVGSEEVISIYKSQGETQRECSVSACDATIAADDGKPSSAPALLAPQPAPYDPKDSCVNMGIANESDCAASCDTQFPGDYMDAVWVPDIGYQFCKCNGVGDIDENNRFVCGATLDPYFTCKEVGIIDVFTCDNRCKQVYSFPNTTFHASWLEAYNVCDCVTAAGSYDIGSFAYCGGPPSPPVLTTLPTCANLDIYNKKQCKEYCRDYEYKEEYFPRWNDASTGVSCICSNGAACLNPFPPASGPTSGSNILGVWASSSFLVLLATLFRGGSL